MKRLFIRVLTVCACIVGATSLSAVAQDDPGLQSSALTVLNASLQTGEESALTEFWRSIEMSGTPLVESHPHEDSSRVTFLFRAEPSVNSVRLSSGLNSLLIDKIEPDFASLGALAHFVETDLWYLTFVVGNDLRIPYLFEIGKTGETSESAEVLDPLNPKVYMPDNDGLKASVLELSEAPRQSWRNEKEETGTWKQRMVAGAEGQEIAVYVYLPKDWNPDRAEKYPFLIGLDSFSFGVAIPSARILDFLISSNAIPPTVMLAAELPSGAGLRHMQATAEYVGDRLLPALREELNLSSDPREIVISGTSRRGLIGTYVAFSRSNDIGNVLSLSGSFYWKPENTTENEWLTHRFATEPVKPIRLFVSAGNLETVVTPRNRGHYMVATNRHFRDVLQARGYDHVYWEFAGVHSDLNWQDALARGLTVLLGGN